jgi:hypothetical protein
VPFLGLGWWSVTAVVIATRDVAEVGENILRQLPADEYPHLAEMIIDHAMKPGYGYAEEFEFRLDLILDGLERLRGAG